jgi:hypothetical protein
VCKARTLIADHLLQFAVSHVHHESKYSRDSGILLFSICCKQRDSRGRRDSAVKKSRLIQHRGELASGSWNHQDADSICGSAKGKSICLVHAPWPISLRIQERVYCRSGPVGRPEPCSQRDEGRGKEFDVKKC